MHAADIQRVTCLGSGTIGASWALCFAMNGLDVTLYNHREPSLNEAMGRVRAGAQTLFECGALPGGVDALMERISTTTDLAGALRDAQYIQESVRENLEVKHSTVEAVETYAPADALFGSSSSRMPISDICAPARHKGRYIVAHPFNPPHLLPLVELCKGPDTAQETEDTVYAFFRRLHKEPIRLLKESHGFVANRIQTVVNREMADLVGRGVVSLEDVNKAITYGPGMRYAIMGPTMIYDLGSPDGLRGMDKIMNSSGINLLEETAVWTKNPYPRDDAYYAQVDEIRAHLPEGAGATREEITAWRDRMLIAQLREQERL